MKTFDEIVPAGRASFGIAELADWFGVSKKHVANLIDAGEVLVIDPNVKPKTARRVSREELVKFLTRRSQLAKPPQPQKRNP
jgi:hypothetical protein